MADEEEFTDAEVDEVLAEVLSDMDDDEVADLADAVDEASGEASRAMSRFDRLVAKLVAQGHDEESAKRLAAHIGRKKYGRAGFAALAAKGRAKAKAMRSKSYGHDEIMRFDRYWEGEVEIVRGGTGRDVTAYLAVFDQQAEIKDQHGHYIEVIDRSAFNRTLAHAAGNVSKRVGLFWNHGHDLHGPSALASVPLGSFLEIKSDGQGLISRARYNKTPLAESVLQAIKDGDVRGYSFRGPVFRSDPMRVPKIQRGGQLPTIRRMELGLSEGGPTWAPFYAGAGIVAVRSAAALTELRTLPLRERIEVIARAIGDDDTDLSDSTPEPDEPDATEADGDTTPVTPDDESEEDEDDEDPTDDSPTDSDESLGTEDPPAEGTPAGDSEAARSISAAEIRRRARIALILRSASPERGK